MEAYEILHHLFINTINKKKSFYLKKNIKNRILGKENIFYKKREIIKTNFINII